LRLHDLLTEQCAMRAFRKSISDGEWRTIALVSNARCIYLPGRDKRGKMAIMRQDVDHR
jgi:hypothetical protein